MSAMSVRVRRPVLSHMALMRHPAIDGFDARGRSRASTWRCWRQAARARSTLLALIAGLAQADGRRRSRSAAARLDDASASSAAPAHGLDGPDARISSPARCSATSRSVGQMDSADAAAAIAAAQLAPTRPAARRRRDRRRRRRPVRRRGACGSRWPARAATPDADLILADEPTAHLDHGTAQDIIDALLALAPGKTLIVATHDPVLAARMDRVVTLSAPASPEDAA